MWYGEFLSKLLVWKKTFLFQSFWEGQYQRIVILVFLTFYSARQIHLIGKNGRGWAKIFFCCFFKSNLFPGFIHSLCPRARSAPWRKEDWHPRVLNKSGVFREEELGSPYIHWPKEISLPLCHDLLALF